MTKLELKQIIREVVEESRKPKLKEEMSKAGDAKDLFKAKPNMTVKEIAAELGITVNDVSSALSRYKKKLKSEEPKDAFPVGSTWETPAGKEYKCTKKGDGVNFMKEIDGTKEIQVTEFQTKKWTRTDK